MNPYGLVPQQLNRMGDNVKDMMGLEARSRVADAELGLKKTQVGHEIAKDEHERSMNTPMTVEMLVNTMPGMNDKQREQLRGTRGYGLVKDQVTTGNHFVETLQRKMELDREDELRKAEIEREDELRKAEIEREDELRKAEIEREDTLAIRENRRKLEGAETQHDHRMKELGVKHSRLAAKSKRALRQKALDAYYKARETARENSEEIPVKETFIKDYMKTVMDDGKSGGSGDVEPTLTSEQELQGYKVVRNKKTGEFKVVSPAELEALISGNPSKSFTPKTEPRPAPTPAKEPEASKETDWSKYKDARVNSDGSIWAYVNGQGQRVMKEPPKRIYNSMRPNPEYDEYVRVLKSLGLEPRRH